MKTLDEVKKHVKTTGYAPIEIGRICGFLVAKGVKSPEEELLWLRGGYGTLSDFIAWFDNKDTKKEHYIKLGSCVRLKDGTICQVINISNDELVLMNKTGQVALYTLEDIEGLCNEEEIEDLLNGLAAIGLCFCEDCETIEPFHTAFEPIVDKVVDLVGMLGRGNDAIAGYLEDICNTLPTAKLTTEARFQLCSIFEDLAIALSDEY